METLLLAAVSLLGFANGANDNFKGVATLWGAGLTDFRRALAWATGFTFLGSLAAAWVALGLVSKFTGAALVDGSISASLPFVVAAAFGAGATVLLAARLGLPISTTHALTGALVGAGVAAAGLEQIHFAALARGIVAPLLFSPVVSLALTLAAYPLAARLARSRDCVCVEGALSVDVTAATGNLAAASAVLTPAVRVAPAAECQTGAEWIRVRLSDTLHWASAAAISFARGLNDTPKIVALLLLVGAVPLRFGLVAAAIAAGGALGAARVANTLSKRITPMAAEEAVSANLVAASLVVLASIWALPVSTTHVTAGGIFGIGWMRRGEADWRTVREILLAWVGTVPLGAALAAVLFFMLM